MDGLRMGFECHPWHCACLDYRMLNMLFVEPAQDRQAGGMLWGGDKDEVGKDPVASEFDDDDRAIDEEPDEEDREGSEDEDEKPID
jgi:hypothetical protein